MKMKSLNHVPWPVLISLLIGCGETDPRVAQVALESTRRQAEQNRQMGELPQHVAEGTKQLVEADAQAPLVDPLTGEDLGIPLLGVIDLIVGSSDGAVIADFKTAARSSGPLEIFHEIQLTSYSYRLRHTWLLALLRSGPAAKIKQGKMALYN